MRCPRRASWPGAWGCHGGTATVAYDRLSGEGFVTSRVGAGTFVSEGVPRAGPNVMASDGALRPRPVWNGVPLLNAGPAPAYEFRAGLIDPSRFPFAAWRRLTARELRASAVGRGYFVDTAGHPALRDAIARYVGVSRGVTATPDDVIVTNGTQQAVDVIARVLLSQGDGVAVEDPGHPPARWLFDSLGLEVKGVPVDEQGVIVDALPERARLVYVTPAHQLPMGSTMSLSRRVALLRWAQQHDAAIVEDDYDSEFRYTGRPVEPLRALDTSGRVIYVGSFSKTMLATLRLGYIVAPPALAPALQAAKQVSDLHTALPAQAALAGFIDEGHLARHVRRMRGIYRARHEAITDGISTRFSGELRVVPSPVGLHVSATAAAAKPGDMEAVAQRALAAGVAVHPLSVFRVDGPARAGLVFGYGAIETEDIDDGLRRLVQAFHGR